MANKKFSEFELKTTTSNVSHIVGYNGAENVRITPANFISGSGGPFLPLAGGIMVGDTTHNDNVKSIYGTSPGNDLQIYHSGTDGFIANATGDLKLSATNFRILKPGLGEFIANFFSDGAVQLFYDNSKKFETTSTGISVTGDVQASANATALSNGYFASLSSEFATDTLKLTSKVGDVFKATNFGKEVVILTGVSNTEERMRIDSSGNLGLGTSTPSSKLEIAGINQTGSKSAFKIKNDTTNTKFEIKSISGDYNVQFKDASNIVKVYLDSNGNSYLNGGNVGINTSTPRSIIEANGNISINDPNTALASGDNLNGLHFYTEEVSYNPPSGRSNTPVVKILPVVDSGVGDSFGLTFYTALSDVASQERMRITSAGNVGIGTATPSEKIDIVANDSTMAKFSSIGSLANDKTLLIQSGGDRIIYDARTESTGGVASHSFESAGTERMRLTSDGNFLVGKTVISFSTEGAELRQNGQCIFTTDGSSSLVLNRLTNDGEIQIFRQNNTVVGTISVTGSATSYNTSSDYRLKEDLQDFEGLDLVSKIPVYDYKWKADESRSYGVMAHELEEVLPQAVSGEKDAEEMQSVDYSKIVPLLVKSIQELSAKLEALECQCEKK